MRFSLASLTMLMGVAQGLILARVLLDRRRRNFQANRYLGMLLLLLSVRLLNGFLVRSPLSDLFPFSARWTVYLVFAWVPLLYFYVRALAQPDFRFRKRHLWHFLPAGLLFLATIPYFVTLIFGTRAGALAYGRTWTWEAPFLNSLVIGQQIVYLALIFSLVAAYRRRVKDLVSSLERIRLGWIVGLLAAMAFLTVFLLLVVVRLVAPSPGSWIVLNRDLVFYTVMSLTIFTAGYLALSQPEIFTPPLAKAMRKYEGSSLSPEKADASLKLLLAMMENDALYREEDLSLPVLAEKVGLPACHVSQIINERLKKNFYDFVNGFRVEAAKRRLRDPRSQTQKILAIAFDVGFNSKAVFNRVFKDQTGMTPSAYRARLSAP